MPQLQKIWNELSEMDSDIQVLTYWQKKEKCIIEGLESAERPDDFEFSALIIHRLAKAFNNREMFSSVYHLFVSAYQKIGGKIIGRQDVIKEMKFELARGLHHNRKYKQAKQLFNDLASNGFEVDRIDHWWDQSAYASTRDEIWVVSHILPAISRVLLMIAYLLVSLHTRAFVVSTIAFILISLFAEIKWYFFRVNHYLKEFEDNPEVERIKTKIKKRIVIQFSIVLLIFPIYYFANPLIYIASLAIAIFINAYHYGMNLYYLPNLVATLNRSKFTKYKRADERMNR